ncbi:hypothetical protein AQUCO_00300873v1 [Aquilegia coerulea]|uniref:Protein kinase domain-containing protein n=1 Tax=Aquilegia coerulea TaxID=218851 RepID=A0A2G5F0U8_AQUCA|nr:hypothetical protein AQUCO_00300873v1 [Aquilegia coerulea]
MGVAFSKSLFQSGLPPRSMLQELKQSDNDNGRRRIGEGRSAEVYMVKYKSNTRQLFKMSLKVVAVKCFRDDPNHIKWQNELRILRELDHPNVIKVVCQYEGADYNAIVFPCAAKGNLRDHLSGSIPDHRIAKHFPHIERLSMERRMKIAIKIAKAVSYLHKKSIIHGDIKSENVLIDKGKFIYHLMSIALVFC